MKIGELAKRSGLSPHTIRYYERIGLLPYAVRKSSQRDHDASILVRIEFLDRLKTTGMPIREMLHYAALRKKRRLYRKRATGAAGAIPRARESLCGRTASPSFRPRHQDRWLCQLKPEGRLEMTQHYHTADDNRLERGKRALAEIDGEAGERVIASLADIAPDFARYLLEFPFGDIYSRPGLDLRSREIATIAALTTLGNATPQLKVHIQAGLKSD
jgi:DNA-binding transcriptional MerR regulator